MSFTAVDLVYTSRRRISPIYLLDALAEVALVAGWAVASTRPRQRRERQPSLSRLGYGPASTPVPTSDASRPKQPKR